MVIRRRGREKANHKDNDKSNDGELVKCFDMRSVLIDITQTNKEKLSDYHKTNRSLVLEQSIEYMESSERFSPKNLEPYIEVDSELLSSTRKQSRLSKSKGRPNVYCSEEGCGFETSKINSLRKHIMMHLGKVPYMCNVCGENFERYDNARLHFKRVHIRQELRNILKTYFPITYKCGKCGIIYESENLLNVHRFHSHTKGASHKCKVCGVVNDGIASLKYHMKIIHPTELESYICNECGKYFTSYTGHWHHVQTHTNESTWRCKTCDVKCKTKNYLKTHEMQYHEPKTHICAECGKAFGRPFGLKKHMDSHNNDPNQFQYPCPNCPAKLKRPKSLKDHMLKHTGERPFICKDCEQTFKTGPIFRRHTRVVHQGLRPYVCHFCSFTAGENYSLTVHLRGVHGQVIPSVKNNDTKRRGERKRQRTLKSE